MFGVFTQYSKIYNNKIFILGEKMKNIMIIGMLFVSISYAITITTEVILDSEIKLEWQNQPINETNKVKWLSAIHYCRDLGLDGKSDWRLPNINELKSLMDYSNGRIVSAFEDTTTIGLILTAGTMVYYWSSTSYFNSKDKAYVVEFENGISDIVAKSNTDTHVRCVRDK